MAGPTITVSVLGDATKGVKALDDLGRASKGAADDVDGASTRVGSGLGRMTDAADGGERRFRGMNDTIGGTQSLMDGLASGNIVGVISGLTDLAGGIADFVGPALTKMAEKLGLVTISTEAQTVAQTEANVAMSLNPIALVVIALVALAAAFYVAWTKSETFREIVTGAFDAVTGAAQATWNWIADNWPLIVGILTGGIGLAIAEIVQHWAAIKRGAQETKDFIKDQFDKVVDFFTGLPGRFTSASSGLFNGIKDAFRSALNYVIRGWNGLQFTMPSINTHIPGVGTIGGFTVGVPDIPELAFGGLVRARPGGTIVRVGEAGRDEAVVPLPAGMSMGSTTIYYPAGYNRRQLTDAQRRWTRLNPAPAAS